MLEGIAQRGTSCFVLVAKYYSGDKMKDGEMGGARGTHARYEKYQI